MKKMRALSTLAFTALLVIGCSVNESDSTDGPVTVKQEGKKLFITDRTGKRWEISHAVENYGMVAENFQFGLGPNAIRPLILPEMLSPGDPGYPADDSNLRIMGTTLSDDTRAYPIDVMAQHEVADEIFGELHVAVAY